MSQDRKKQLLELRKSLLNKGSFSDDWLIEVHHYFMKIYGWIPFEEFKELPLETINNLILLIKKDNEKLKS